MKGKDVKSALSFNYIFTGSPGTGKTTVARLMGKMFSSLGLIPDDEVIEKSASDFVTGYVNQAGKQTRNVFTEALGRVLFIDEAYQLNPDKGGQFMSEVVDEMVKLLTSEEFQGKLVVILAGYAGDIDEMLQVNAGLKSRFTERIHFEDFAEETIVDMLRGKMSDKHVCLDANAHIPHVARALKALPGFANGRDVQTFLKKLELALAAQYKTTRNDDVTVSALQTALSEIVALRAPHTHTTAAGASLSAAVVVEKKKRRPLLLTQTMHGRPPSAPSFEFAIDAAEDEEAEKEKEEEEETASRNAPPDEASLFLQSMQSVLDGMGLNTAAGVEQLSSLPPDHALRRQVAQEIATQTGVDVERVRELMRKWSGDQAKVREELRRQREEEQRAEEEGREALVPIWRCGVCGRADQPYIACYVAPFIVRYEKRRLK